MPPPASAWWEGRLCGFDVESSGVSVEDDRIVSAAVVLVGGGVEPERLTLLADPGVEIPEAASAVHGITTERARAEGKPAADVLAALRATLATAIDAGHPLVVMNARFDLTMLDRELARHGLDPLPPPRVIDPLVIDKHLDRYRKGSRKLDALCAHYGATLDDAHEAGADALAACRLAWRMGSSGQIVRRAWNAQMAREKAALDREWESVRSDLSALHEAQRGWAREQAEGLREHFASTGKTEEAASVRLDWPCVPVGATT